ncbi:Uncharacterised protein [Mycobacteroides abscessus subsp. abscessus]|nr:Uncharacterised protein [Mycobacteroides abscessus subsp. abscessus]
MAAAYIASGGLGRSAPMLEMLTIDPPPAAAIRAPATAINRNGPLRFTSRVLSHRPSPTAARFGASGAMPALLTTMSRLPNSAMIASTAGSMVSHCPTCSASGWAAPVGTSASVATARSQESSLRLETITVAPACLRPRAMARPSPRLAPVTRATLPVRSVFIGTSSPRDAPWCADGLRWDRRRSAVPG